MSNNATSATRVPGSGSVSTKRSEAIDVDHEHSHQPEAETGFSGLTLSADDERAILDVSEQAALIWWFQATSSDELVEQSRAAQLITERFANELVGLDEPLKPSTPDQLRILDIAIAFVDVDFVVVEITLEVIATNGQQLRYFELEPAAASPTGWLIRSAQ